jgi:hypothetical protein
VSAGDEGMSGFPMLRGRASQNPHVLTGDCRVDELGGGRVGVSDAALDGVGSQRAS